MDDDANMTHPTSEPESTEPISWPQNAPGPRPAENPARDHRTSRFSGRAWLAVVAAVAIATAAGLAIGRATGSPAVHAAQASSSLSGCPGRAKVPTNNMNTPDASLGQVIGREAGTAMAGDAPMTVSTAQVTSLGNQIPAGALVVACTDRIVFATHTVSFVVEAAPPNNPDMTFRTAGLVDPTVEVPLGAQVDIEFINADTDEAHALVISSVPPPYALRVAAFPAFPGAVARPIGDPTSAGHGASILSFVASSPGTYYYLCPMPGHAEMGMAGQFVVQ